MVVTHNVMTNFRKNNHKNTVFSKDYFGIHEIHHDYPIIQPDYLLIHEDSHVIHNDYEDFS
jgi:hypothetical protein